MSSKFEWSPSLQAGESAIRYWKLCLCILKGASVSESTFDHLHKLAFGSPYKLDILTQSDLSSQLTISFKHLRNLQKVHSFLRLAYLDSLAEALVLQSSPNLAHDSVSHIREEWKLKTIKQLWYRECMRRAYRKIGFTLHHPTNLGLDRLDIPDPAASDLHLGNPSKPKSWKGPWVSLTDPNDIAKEVIKMNIAQYHQAHETPFSSGPLADLVGRAADTPSADSLLSGELSSFPPGLPETHRILSILSSPTLPSAPTPDISISDEDFIAAYKATPESTSSSLSDRHVGHYKAVLSNQQILQMHCGMMSIPFITGVSPKRWN
jgi:hypothetical protein